jgi:hypothetical protein
MMHQRRISQESVCTRAETHLGWKKWILSHHYFIPLLAMTGHTLSSAAEAMRDGRQEEARKATDAACRMRRGCGAAVLYSVDFQPCSEIYCSQIRSQMPPAFSGFEIRERQNGYQPALAQFNSEFSKNSTDPFVEEMRAMWIAADVHYRQLHERCMLKAVASKENAEDPGQGKPESLRAAHRREHGEVPPIKEENYATYDRWFGIDRQEHFTWLDYVHEICDVIERVLADLMVGHRLEADTVDELMDSMRAVLTVFKEQISSSNETFFSCPQKLQGMAHSEAQD